MIFALIGNQNCGKTTLFNQLTGANQHVGNFPGVTVDSKAGKIRTSSDCSVVDLPGIYSLRPYSNEEIVSRDFILQEKPDAIINIADATNLERNLYLTLQVLEMGIPTVLALNMMDEVRANGGKIDVGALSDELGIPVIPVSAAKNEGVAELVEITVRCAENKVRPKRTDFSSGAVHRCLCAVGNLISDHAESADIPRRFAASKAIEADEDIIGRLSLNEHERRQIERLVAGMEHECGMDRHAAIADMRYSFIEAVCSRTVIKPRESREHARSVKIDRILTGKYVAIPLFICIMLAIFWLTFAVIGQRGQTLMETGVNALCAAADHALTDAGVNSVLHSLIIDGIFAGVGSVLSFLPIIVVLFFFLSILEDSGYMARVAFIMDRPLRKLGLSGKSFVPMLIGFGCSVPAIMATRTLSSERDRKMTILLVPYMSCSAKIPIYAMFASAFFARGKALIMVEIYLVGILVGIAASLVMKHTVFRGASVPFVMELPNYRMPSLKSVLMLMWEKARDFLQRAFTVIFVAAIIIWALQNFDLRLHLVADAQQSLLAVIGKRISPVFRPLGFEGWELSTALIAGFTAKEAVISTLSVLTGGAPLTALFSGKLAAFSFLIFTLLYTPCVAAFAAIRRELRSMPKAIGVAVLQCVIAYFVAALFYQVGRLVL